MIELLLLLECIYIHVYVPYMTLFIVAVRFICGRNEEVHRHLLPEPYCQSLTNFITF